MNKYILTAFILVSSITAFAQRGYVHHWEMLIETTDEWSVLKTNTEPDTNWHKPGFDVSSWDVETGGFAYGTDTISTFYLVKTITVENRDSISAMLFQADYNGAFVIYLNGYEVARKNIAGSFNHPAITDTALFPHPQNGKFEDMLVHEGRLAYSLQSGTNTIAIQVHHFPEYPSVSATFATFVGSISPSIFHKALPDYFVVPPTYSPTSDLPIVYIDTDGQSVDSLSKITAHMGIVYSPLAKENVFSAPFNHFDGQISIKYRGQSSLEFPKKSYTIETQTETGGNLNVPLLGMPQENDWVLYAPYSDKSLIRNALAYKTFESFGHYAPRTRFVELMLNGYYQGVYVLVEKIKRDKFRVDMAKLEPHEVFGDDMTGGYLIRNDKGGEIGVDSWRGDTDLSGTDFRETVFQLDYPDPAEVAPEQLAYIQQFCDSMETAILSLKYTNDKPDYLKYIDLGSWVDKFILTELCKDVDSYRYSEYMYKQKNSNGGKMVMGPVWDYNTGFGNLNYGSGEFWLTENWVQGNSSNQIYWYQRLFADDYFVASLVPRWEVLRTTALSDEAVSSRVDSLSNMVAQAQVRNHYQWHTLGRYVWPNQFVADTYDEEIYFMQTWLADRLLWMDENMPEPQAVFTIMEQTTDQKSLSWPNPFTESVYFSHQPNAGDTFTVVIRDASGNTIGETNSAENTNIAIWNPSLAESGVFFYSIYEDAQLAGYGKIVRL